LLARGLGGKKTGEKKEVLEVAQGGGELIVGRNAGLPKDA